MPLPTRHRCRCRAGKVVVPFPPTPARGEGTGRLFSAIRTREVTEERATERVLPGSRGAPFRHYGYEGSRVDPALTLPHAVGRRRRIFHSRPSRMSVRYAVSTAGSGGSRLPQDVTGSLSVQLCTACVIREADVHRSSGPRGCWTGRSAKTARVTPRVRRGSPGDVSRPAAELPLGHPARMKRD